MPTIKQLIHDDVFLSRNKLATRPGRKREKVALEARSSLGEQIEGTCPHYGLCTIAGPQFRENITHVVFHRIERHYQVLGNFLVGGATFQQVQHAQFALA